MKFVALTDYKSKMFNGVVYKGRTYFTDGPYIVDNLNRKVCGSKSVTRQILFKKIEKDGF